MARQKVDLGAEKAARRDEGRRTPQRCCTDPNCKECFGTNCKTDWS